jgi:phosphopantetheine--protein transferase-like protein
VAAELTILTGIDIVDIKRFETSVAKGGDKFLKSIFVPEELANKNTIHLAGLFAAKEAVMKAFSLKNNVWLKVIIHLEKSGRPVVILHSFTKYKVRSSSLSIAHEQDKAVAVFSALVEN